MAWLVRLFPWIAGATSIAAVLLWAQQSGIRLASHEHTAERLASVGRTLAARDEQRTREYAITGQHIIELRESRDRIAELQQRIDELETPNCTLLGPDWVRVYNDSNR